MANWSQFIQTWPKTVRYLEILIGQIIVLMKQQNTDRVNSLPNSPPPSTVCLVHLHLELSFIILQLLLPFLIIVIVPSGLADHAEEAGVANIEVVVSAEGAPPVLERHSLDFVHEDPLQAHALGLPSHL